MTNGACKRIGGIGGRHALERKQSLHHRLHLALVRTTEADHGLLDSQCSVFMNDKSLGDCCADRRATRLAKQQRRLRIDVDENFFDRSDLWLRIANHLAQ